MTNHNRLKVVLVEQDNTGKRLAGKLGKSTCTISKWYQNSNQFDLSTMTQSAKSFNV